MKPTIYNWKGTNVVKVSDVKGFRKWLCGQTVPIVKEKENPFDWAYEWDYERFIHNQPIID